MRDLCRARAALLADRTRARHRLSKFLLRHGQVWRGGATAWTVAHERWLLAQRFQDPALAATYGHYRAVLTARDAELEAIEADLATWFGRPPFADQVARLAAYRGVTRLGALTLASEVSDYLAGSDHQMRQRAPARPAGRVGLGLPAPPPGDPGVAPPPGWGVARDGRPGLDRPAEAVRTVPPPARPQERQAAGGHRRRPRVAGFLWAEMTA